MNGHDNPYPDPRLARLESRVDSIDQRVGVTEAMAARLDERSARIAEDVSQMRRDIHDGLEDINQTVSSRSAAVNRLAWFLGTVLIGTLIAVIADLAKQL